MEGKLSFCIILGTGIWDSQDLKGIILETEGPMDVTRHQG
jgi:hypothetical protein